MKKGELVKKAVEVTIFWWSITENKEYYEYQKQELTKAFWKSSKESLINRIQNCENRIANAKAKLEVVNA